MQLNLHDREGRKINNVIFTLSLQQIPVLTVFVNSKYFLRPFTRQNEFFNESAPAVKYLFNKRPERLFLSRGSF